MAVFVPTLTVSDAENHLRLSLSEASMLLCQNFHLKDAAAKRRDKRHDDSKTWKTPGAKNALRVEPPLLQDVNLKYS